MNSLKSVKLQTVYVQDLQELLGIGAGLACDLDESLPDLANQTGVNFQSCGLSRIQPV